MNQSSLNLEQNSLIQGAMSENSDEKASSQKTFGVKSIRTEKFDPIYRQVANQHAPSNYYEDFLD